MFWWLFPRQVWFFNFKTPNEGKESLFYWLTFSPSVKSHHSKLGSIFFLSLHYISVGWKRPFISLSLSILSSDASCLKGQLPDSPPFPQKEPFYKMPRFLNRIEREKIFIQNGRTGGIEWHSTHTQKQDEVEIIIFFWNKTWVSAISHITHHITLPQNTIWKKKSKGGTRYVFMSFQGRRSRPWRVIRN